MDPRVELNTLKARIPQLRNLSVTYGEEKRGPDNAQEWHVVCNLGGHSVRGTNWHGTIAEAKKDAAANMITYINNNRFTVCRCYFRPRNSD